MITQEEFKRLYDDLDEIIVAVEQEKYKLIAGSNKDDWRKKKYDYIDVKTKIDKESFESYELRELKELEGHLDLFLELLGVLQNKDAFLDNPSYESFKRFTIHGDTSTVEEMVERLIESKIEECEFSDTAYDYGEPGYTKNDDEKPILFHDWNNYPNSLLFLMEDAGYSYEWEDEWIVNEEGIAFRTQPDKIGWEQSYFTTEDDRILSIEGNEEEYIAKHMDCVEKAISSRVDPALYGWKSVGEICHETGLYAKNEDPEDMLEEIEETVEDFESMHFLFQICAIGPFSITWKLWIKEEGEEDGDE